MMTSNFIITSQGSSKAQQKYQDFEKRRQAALSRITEIMQGRGHDRRYSFSVAKRFVAIYGV